MTLLASGFLIGMLQHCSLLGLHCWQTIGYKDMRFQSSHDRHGFGCAAGPSGFTVREIIRQTDADIKSWTDKCEDDTTRPTRTFIIEVVSLPTSSVCHLA